MTIADKIALWGMIGSWISGVGTLVAAVFAWKALSSWKSQEKRNDRKALKIALIQYRHLLTVMPEKLQPNPDFSKPALTLQEAMNQIYQAVTILEVDLNNSQVGKKYVELNQIHNEFLRGLANRNDLAKKTIYFLAEPFIDKAY